MSFSEIYPQQDVSKKKYLQTDWKEEDCLFKECIVEFQKSIACANPNVECIKLLEEDLVPEKKNKEEKKDIPQTPPGKEVVIDDEEKAKNITSGARDVPGDSVVSSHAEGSKEDHRASKPTKAETNVNEDFDDIFSSPSEKAPTKQEPAIVKVPAAAGKAVTSDDTSMFDEKPTAQNWKTPEEPKATLTKSDEGPTTCDLVILEQVEKHANEVLAQVSTQRIKALEDALPQYAVTLELDHYRRSPEIIPENLGRVQGMRDSMTTPLIEISDLVTMFDDAEVWYLDVGSESVNAKNQKGREAFVRLRVADFFKTHTRIKKLKNAYDITFKALCNQYEFLSRLISALGQELKGGGPGTQHTIASNGRNGSDAPPFDGPYKAVTLPVAKAESHVAKQEPKAHVPPSQKSTAGLDAFEVPNKEKKAPTTGFVGGDNFDF